MPDASEDDTVALRPAVLPRPVELEEPGPSLGDLLRWTVVTLGSLVALGGAAAMLGAPVPLPALGPLGAVDVFGVGLVVAFGPAGIHAAREARETRDLEERFPDFLRDLASNRRAGVALADAVEAAAESEVERMAAQLSWDVPFEEVIQRFRDRVATPLVDRACAIVLQAERAGGRITDVLVAASRDVRALRALQNERRSTMAMYTIVVYLSFLVFLAVAVMLHTQFLPQLVEAGEAAGQQGLGGGFEGGSVNLEDYRQFFYVSSVVQGVGGGVLAGVLAHGDPRPGLQHAALMVAISAAVFGFLAL